MPELTEIGVSPPAVLSRYDEFDRTTWAALRASTPLTLDEADLASLRGLNDRLDLAEVTEVYLPLSRLLNLHVAASQQLAEVTDTFLGNLPDRVPYIIGIAGSVAVGKSTTARILQAMLARWPHHPRVDLVTTDGFLYPNGVLEERGLMQRKGFPESYDTARLVEFLQRVKAGEPLVSAPVYSHTSYDIVADVCVEVESPDVLIVEGLNVLQTRGPEPNVAAKVFVSDFFDFSIYVDAPEALVRNWYVERFLALRDTVFRHPDSYFRRYAALDDGAAVQRAEEIWGEINGPNLVENILPTRERADLILEKGADHAVQRVRLRKI